MEEDISRRGLLKGLGTAAGLGSAGYSALRTPNATSPATQTQPVQQQLQPQKQFTPVSDNPKNELYLLKAAKSQGLKGPELAQFMGQMKHESWDFSRMHEKPQPGIPNYYARKYDIRYAPKTAKILGNKVPGDGEKYYGRGYVQLTGRDNYKRAGEALGIDLLKNPDLASRPDIASLIAVWYWNNRVKPYVNDFNNTKQVTQKINPAAKGLENRHENYKTYLAQI